MIDDDKGQISIEYILVIGAILIMVIAGIPVIMKNAEMNRGLTAARDGATKGAAMRGMGFSSTGGNVAGVVKIINITPEYQGNVNGTDRYLLRFYISVPSNMIDNPTCTSSSVGSTITNQALRYMHYSFNSEWLPVVGSVTGSYYRFTASCDFV